MLPLVRQSLTNPRDAALRILGAGPSAALGLQGIGLVAALGGLMVGVLSGGRLELPTVGGSVALSPLAYAAVLFLTLVLGSVALASAGRALGGTGTVGGALALVAWLQAIDLGLQVIGIAAMILLPPLAPLVALAGLAILIWCVLGFVQALHGVGPGRALGTILLAMLGLGVTLAVLLGLSGLGATPDV
jgi:hypothetical protein